MDGNLPIWILACIAVGTSVWALVLRNRLAHAERKVRENETEQNRVLERLRDNEDRLRAIIESSPECVKLHDANGVIMEINPAGMRLVDAERLDQLVGHSILDVVAPEHKDYYRDCIAKVFAGESAIYAFRGIGFKGRSCWMETHAVPLRDPAGRIYAALGVTRDITAKMQAEERARQHHAEMAHVARLSSLGEMATGLAHELNQPLSAIANFARGCIRRLGDARGPNEQLRMPLEEICVQAERAGEILRHVREFVRKSDFKQVEVDVNETVRSMARLTELETRQHGTALWLDLGDPLPSVRGDPIMIEQVLCNLVRNAAEAMHGAQVLRRDVTVSTRWSGNGSIEVAVSDTGPGVGDEIADQVFDQFFTTKPEGVGMGLAISRSIVEAHGGTLRLAPAERGACFRFTLPVGP